MTGNRTGRTFLERCAGTYSLDHRGLDRALRLSLGLTFCGALAALLSWLRSDGGFPWALVAFLGLFALALTFHRGAVRIREVEISPAAIRLLPWGKVIPRADIAEAGIASDARGAKLLRLRTIRAQFLFFYWNAHGYRHSLTVALK